MLALVVLSVQFLLYAKAIATRCNTYWKLRPVSGIFRSNFKGNDSGYSISSRLSGLDRLRPRVALEERQPTDG